jgi:hypothetical protein
VELRSETCCLLAVTETWYLVKHRDNFTFTFIGLRNFVIYALSEIVKVAKLRRLRDAVCVALLEQGTLCERGRWMGLFRVMSKDGRCSWQC